MAERVDRCVADRAVEHESRSMICEQERTFSRMFGRYTPSGEVREVLRHLGRAATEIDGDLAINGADEQRAVDARVVPCSPLRKRCRLAKPTMESNPHPDTFNSPFNLWRREIAAHAAQPFVAARIAKIGAPQGILAEACEHANRAHIALAQLSMPFPEHHVDLKPTQALDVAKREILLATVFFEAAHAKGAPAINVATCRAGLVNMWHQYEAATTAPASTTPPSD